MTPGHRLESIPLGSHLNLACDVEESVSGTFTLDNQVNQDLNGNNGQLSNNNNLGTSQLDGKYVLWD